MQHSAYTTPVPCSIPFFGSSVNRRFRHDLVNFLLYGAQSRNPAKKQRSRLLYHRKRRIILIFQSVSALTKSAMRLRPSLMFSRDVA